MDYLGDMDAFTAEKLERSIENLIPADCKEYNSTEGSPLFDYSIISGSTIAVECANADRRDPTCLQCLLARGREFSI